MKIHFIGIGGIGISALARIFVEQGHQVSGSDLDETDLTRDLQSIGIQFFADHKTKNVPDDVEKIIYTEAIPKDNPEFQKACSLKIPCLTYFQALGEFAKDYKVIAIAGAHGKTTTTAMIALSLIAGDIDPTVVVGTKIREFGNINVRTGKSEYLVVEACEYRESFLHLTPHLLVITNIEAEHLDYYKTEENYLNAFRKLVAKVPADGMLIVSADDENSLEVAKESRAQVLKLTTTHYSLPTLSLPGDHYKIDAGFAMAVGLKLGVKAEIIQKELSAFKGTWRRFEIKGEKNGVIVIDDYAHHPTEIQATLKGARQQYPNQKIICVFQPHQYSRTRLLFNDFTKSFSECDQVIVPNIYRVRDTEKDVQSTSAQNLVKGINQQTKNAIFGDGFTNTVKILKNTLQKGDILITMGAGPVNEVGEKFLF